MLTDLWVFLLDVFVQGYAGLLFARFLLQWLRVPLRNPLGEFIMALTDKLVLPARRHIPAMAGLDTASLLLAWGIETLYLALLLTVQHYLVSVPGLLVLAGVKLLGMAVQILMGALIAQAILSWVNPHTPLAPVLNAVTRPFLAPLQRVIPPIGNVDLSTLVLLVVLQIVLMMPMRILEGFALRLM